MDWITTSTILDDLRDGQNLTAWQRFAERFRPSVVRFACKLGLPDEDAEDVAQETLAAFAIEYRDGRYDRSRGRLSRWLFGIAYRQAQKARSVRARRARVEGEPERTSFWETASDDEAAARTWDQQWEQALLEQCLQRVRQELGPSTMRAFELAALAERAPAEVAKELGLSVKAVYHAKYRVLRRIRELRAVLEGAE